MKIAIVCLDCRGLVQPYECPTVTECSTHEVCYIEKYETSNGQKSSLYNVGCKPLNFCSSSGPVLPVIGKRSARKRIDTTTCHECCSDKDICNLEGHCGSKSATLPVGSTICYSCPLAMDSNKCNHIALCDRDSACSLKQIRNLIGQPRWTHGCSEKSQCATIAQSNPQGICSFCCDTELCNRNCTIRSTIAPPATTTTMAPAIHITQPQALNCYYCELISHEKDCNHTTKCNPGEDQCYLSRVDGGSIYGNLCFYKMGCMARTLCRISLLITISFVVRSSIAIICLDCRRIPQPYDCTTVTECSTNEVCYIEKYETSNGQKTWHLYNVGCKPLNSCTSSGPSLPVVGKRSARKSIDTTTCDECCSDKDICNLEGHCGSENFTKPFGSTLCYDCPLSKSSNTCNQLTLCYSDSACSLTQTRNLLGEPRWMHGCSQKSQCSTVAQINPQGICSFCCDTELCNRNCTIKSTVATPLNTTSTTTTTMAPTTHIPQTAPIITQTVILPTNIRYGNTVTIQCLATGNPKPTIDFLVKGRRLGGNVHVDPNTHILTISNFVSYDDTFYRCIASNPLGEDHKDFKLQGQ
ncbi:uncharacterized protein LOC134717803 [Mytilus trossulus]|uniref:uncharacterized protein LOC134717803 n=1 Tax=Mytilus trossulus TaxID=6551 RepID=UPI0030048756